MPCFKSHSFTVLKARPSTENPPMNPHLLQDKGGIFNMVNQGLPRLVWIPCDAHLWVARGLDSVPHLLTAPPSPASPTPVVEGSLTLIKPFSILEDASSFFSVPLSKSPPQWNFPRQNLVLLTSPSNLSIYVVVNSVCTRTPAA